ncbi:major facilitator superfamily domain-containing protein [Xylariaceae sp. FL0016]|nr:major facilitator superfamily domain-containing protein [Xylariaceae sp. FL0016]
MRPDIDRVGFASGWASGVGMRLSCGQGCNGKRFPTGKARFCFLRRVLSCCIRYSSKIGAECHIQASLSDTCEYSKMGLDNESQLCQAPPAPEVVDRNGAPVDEERCIVSFEPNDPQNPYNWKTTKKAYVIFTTVVLSLNSTMGSALASNLTPFLQAAFAIPPGPQTVLPASVFLVGFVCGPLLFAPLSEYYGRRPVLQTAFCLFFLATLATALAPTWPSFLFFRFLAGTFGAPPTTVVGGMIADVFEDPVYRGRMLMVWSASTFLGPLTAPILAGFTGPVEWRWTFRAAVIIAGITLVLASFLPETFAPKLLRQKAARLNRDAGTSKYISPGDMKRESVLDTLKTTMSRPWVILSHEMIIILACIYMAFIYAVFYMMLAIFPRIFVGVYKFSRGIEGVAFLMFGVGTSIACGIYLWYDRVGPRLGEKHPSKVPEYRRLPPACAGGPLFVIALLWMGWTSKPEIPWIVPLLSAIPYGCAFQMIFMALFNYITDAYGIYAASALAACSSTRAVVGAVLPLAVNDMLDALGISWACTLLALISAALGLVPLGFITWGEKIRARSRYSNKLQSQSQDDGDLVRTMSLV